MELSPFLYHRIVRPKWINQFYVHNRISQYLKLQEKNVLDFGAGTGANCTLCKPGKYVGIDPDESRINLAKRLYPKYDFHVFQNDELTVEENSIDVILIVAVLHHIPPEKTRSYVKEFRKAMRPDGMMVIIEPCLFENRNITNWFMKTMDNGAYIQNETGYHDFFLEEGFNCTTIQRFRKCFLYNELFFIVH